ncbi:four helix bundle protein [Nostoc spongiaeforme FACHB-130]|uniref:Four helix bundle protein n=1 Tax=Nostoc spongiaeforme FACHB-130 TaxID=1357510 RepID=A0ABR8FT90_9NOSO|nr:four helix bundle protein [Nostoc spongiaeforme]MBD2594649.1 four helix bundle protein [Nostoc spongiaeforme FACHB-130]
MNIGYEGKPKDIRERTFNFAIRIVKVCQLLDERPGVGRTLSKQLLRSGTSIGANVEEAKAGQSKPDFISKNAIALKEARETHYWLRLLGATKVLPQARLSDIQLEAEELMRIIGAIIVSAKNNHNPK